jgi:tetratricopeptide (TPR) repeat protein
MPGSLSPYQNLFVSFVQTRQAGAALAILDEAAAQPQADPEYLIHLAELYATCGAQFPELRQSARSRAVAALNRAAPARELSPALRLKLADGLNLLGDNEQAAAAYLYLVNQPDLSPPLRELLRAKLADLYLRERDPRQAVAQLEAIVRDNPANSAAYYFLGRIALEQKQWTNAVDHFQKMILFNPELEQAHYDLAAAQLALDRAEDAAATLEAARKRFPPGFAAEYLLGVTEHARKRYAEAVNHLTSAEHLAQSAGETNRLNHGFYFQLGASFERKGDRAAAEKHFEKALLLAPDDPETLNYLGYMWAERGENLDRALAMIERAVKSDPTNAAFLDSLGWVLFQLGRPGEAVEYLLQSIAHDEKPDATVLDHLGDVYAALKEWSKAREAWTRSLSVEASDLVRKKLEPAPAP